MTWRVAKSLNVLLNQLNTKFPGRDKSSDGSIGDAQHASRSSDHNPWVHDHTGQPVVTARDFTNDHAHMDSHLLALALAASKDERIKYIIDHNQICSGTGQDKPAWVWRPYPTPPNKNPHDHHCHVSVKSDEAHFDDERPWVINMPTAVSGSTPSGPVSKTYVTLRVGATGKEVGELQTLLNKNGFSVVPDEAFGEKTRRAVINFQVAKKLVADGVVGKYTWLALGG